MPTSDQSLTFKLRDYVDLAEIVALPSYEWDNAPQRLGHCFALERWGKKGFTMIIIKLNRLRASVAIMRVVVFVLFLAVVQLAQAATFTWDGNGATPPNGNFSTAANWNPNTAPGSSDTAQFNLGGGVSYTVSFPGSGAIGLTPVDYVTSRLVVTSTNTVTFSEVNATSSYTLSNTISRGIIVGLQAGDNATLNSALSSKTAGLSAATATVGDGTGSVGTLNVTTGLLSITANDTINNNELMVGNSGSGALNITGGAAVKLTGDSGTSIVGNNTTGSGVATVSGNGSSWSHTGSNGTMVIGSDGSGALNVLDGGKVNAVLNYFGAETGSTGTATVDGAGSVLANNGALFVGELGHGTLNITAGGQLAVLQTDSALGATYLGYNAGSVGTVNVSGTGSSFNGGATVVGKSGSGTINISAGAQATDLGTTVGDSSTGTINITGSGSKLNANVAPAGFSIQTLDIGENGRGFVNVTNGAQLVCGGNSIMARFTGSIGIVTVDGTGSLWSNVSGLVVGSNGTGTLLISGGGQVTDTTASLGSGAGSGTVNVDGAGTQWTNSSSLTVGVFSVGMLTITNGGHVSSSSGAIGQGASSFGLVTIDGTGANWVTTGDIVVGSSGTASLTVRNGATASVGGLLSVGAQGTLHGNSVITGNVQNGGVVAPNSSSSAGGALHVNGNFTQTAGGDLQIGLGGTSAGSQYDQLLVSSAVSLAGKLDVSLINGFEPVAGNAFNILDWSTLTGTFSGGVQLPTMGGRIVWDASHLYDSGALGGTISVLATYYTGDFNRDGHVNAADILAAMRAMADLSGYEATNGLTNPTLFNLVADVNGDGSVNSADLQKLLLNLTSGGGSADPVPEPSTFVLAVLAFGTMRWRFRFSVGQSRRLVPVAVPSTR